MLWCLDWFLIKTEALIFSLARTFGCWGLMSDFLSGNCPWPKGAVLLKVTAFPEGRPYPVAGQMGVGGPGLHASLGTLLQSHFNPWPLHKVSWGCSCKCIIQFKFSLHSCPLILLLHRGCSQDNSPANFLCANYCVRVYPGKLTYDCRYQELT